MSDITVHELAADRDALTNEIERVIAGFELRTGTRVEVRRYLNRVDPGLVETHPVRVEVVVP